MTFPGSASPKFRFVAVAAAFATLYFLAAALTDSLVGDPGIAVLWPASGVYLGVMLVAPRQRWPALACGAGLGSLAAYAHAGSSLELSIAFAVPSSAEGLLAAVLVERIARRRFTLGGLQDLSALVVGGAVVATALVALSAGAVAAQTFNASFAESWLRWWSADALGVLALAPLIAALPRRGPRAASGGELRYAACVVAGVAFAVWSEPSSSAAMVGGALSLPVLLWAGWRWGPRAAALGGAGVALAAMHLASQGVRTVQAFLAVLLLGSLAFAAAVADWRREHASAGRSRRRLRDVMDGSPDAYLAVDDGGRIAAWSASAETMFGWDASQALGRSLEETIGPGAGPATPTPEAREHALMARQRGGRQFPAALTVRPGSERDAGLCHVFVRDLTDTERLGRALGRANAELERRGLARDEVRTELEATSEELERAGRRSAQLTADLSARSTELGESRSALAAAKEELSTLSREHADATSGRDRARSELDESAREHERLRAELRSAADERERVRAELDNATGEHARLQTELESAADDQARLRVQLDNAAGQNARLRGELDSAGSEQERVRAELYSAAGELARARAGSDTLEEELESVRAERARTAEELAGAVSGQRSAEHELEQARARLAEERGRLERSLEEAAVRLAGAEAERRLLDEHATELISRYDDRGICVYASSASRRLLGYEPEELVGRPGAELLHPDDRGRLLRVRASGSESTFDARLRRKAGDFVWVEVSFHPVQGHENERLLEVSTTVREISRERAAEHGRRMAETRFHSLFGTMPIGSALLGHDGRVEKVNLALCRLTGYSRDQLEGAALATIVDDEDAAVFNGRLRRVASGQVATLRLEQLLVHASGRTVPVDLSVTPLPSSDSAETNGSLRLHELVVHFQDLSDRAGARDEARPVAAIRP
jgi:PAS domain S-box-containing protein